MYKCIDCNELFEEPLTQETNNFLGKVGGYPAFQIFKTQVCPCCQSETICLIKPTCRDCKYIKICGDPDRYDSCNGYEAIRL